MESARLNFFQHLLQHLEPGLVEVELEIQTVLEISVGDLHFLAVEVAEEVLVWWPWQDSPCPTSPDRSRILTAKERNHLPGKSYVKITYRTCVYFRNEIIRCKIIGKKN